MELLFDGLSIYYGVCIAILLCFTVALGIRKCSRNRTQGIACTCTTARQWFDQWVHKTDTLKDVLDRHDRHTMDYDELQAHLSTNLIFSELMQGISQNLADFCIQFLPSGSMAEGYGALRNSRSALASDIDLMLIPSGTALLAGTGRQHMFKVELQKPDPTSNYIRLRLDPKHPASKRWNSMCSAEHDGWYVSTVRVRTALGNALREDWYSRGTIIYPDRRIIINQEGPALNVKIQDHTSQAPEPNYEPEPPNNNCCSCLLALCCCMCFISPLILLIPVYALCSGKTICDVLRCRRAKAAPQGETSRASNVLVASKNSTDINEPKVHFEADFVFALPIQWNNERTRQWEDAANRSAWLLPQHIENLKRQQCYAVPKPPQSRTTLTNNKKKFAAWNTDGTFFKIGESSEGGTGLHWRMSFSKQEEELAKHIRDNWPHARQAFLGVKAAVKMKTSGMASYAVKSAFLLFMDSMTPAMLAKAREDQRAEWQHPQWRRSAGQARQRRWRGQQQLQENQFHPAEEIFYWLIDFMIEKIKQGNIPHYFIRETNLIRDLDNADRHKIIMALTAVRKDPAAQLGIQLSVVKRGCCPC